MSAVDHYFGLLPDEILIKILSQIDTFTLINFYKTYPNYDYVFRDRKVIRNLNFSKKFKLNNFPIYEFIKEKFGLELVTCLNINSIYWIPAIELRKFIKKLINLESLQAIDTTLDLKMADIVAYQSTKINKLAVNGEVFEIHSLQLDNIRTLYLKFSTESIYESVYDFVKLFPQLKNLWIDSLGTSTLFIDNFINIVKLNKLIYKVNSSYPRAKSHGNFINYYKSHAGTQPFCVCFEYFDDISTVNNDKTTYANSVKDELLKKAWQDLDSLHYCPFGPKDARKLLNEINLGNIYFGELSFSHESTCCVDKFYNAAKTILKSSQVNKLKKLCIMDCLLQENQLPVLGHQNCDTTKNKTVEELRDNLTLINIPDLEDLEVIYCSSVRFVSVSNAYLQISNLKKLKSLTLKIPVFVDGSFLIEVLQNCEFLETLRITSLSQNETLSFNVNKAIKYGSSLKDFRFEHYRIQMDQLLESLCSIKTTNLQRIYLKCKSINQFTSGPLTKLLQKNHNLVFLYIIISEVTQACIKKVQETLKLYSTGNRAKVYIARKKCFGRQFPVPDVHYDDMVAFESKVATVNAHQDFLTF